MTQTDTMLAKVHGLVKIHKHNAPLRPVISLNNTPKYKFGKFLYQDLKKSISLPKLHIKNSFEFVGNIESYTFCRATLYIKRKTFLTTLLIDLF